MVVKLNLRARILSVMVALTSLCLVGGLVSFWFTIHLRSLVSSIVDGEAVVMRTIEEMDSALVMQKGYLTYFFQDGDDNWLVELDGKHRDFVFLLEKAANLFKLPEERETLSRIESKYGELAELRDRVVALYHDRRREEGYRLHQQARLLFFDILDMSESLKTAHWQRIALARAEFLASSGRFAKLSLLGVGIALVLGVLLGFVLIRQVLRPIRYLAQTASQGQPVAGRRDEVQALREGVHILIEDVDEARSQLRLSREHLIEASKLASVGKLAAGVAHSIRNPLTSVKMRLFSLEQSLDLTPIQKEDFQVISDEIRHIDNIVRNFLEFSRRPKLRLEPIDPSSVVDGALTLLSHRLDSHGVRMVRERGAGLPRIEADPEQLKEVVVNLIVNACEALASDVSGSPRTNGAKMGRIVITEEQVVRPVLGPALVIRVGDNGPGIPEEIKERIFQPLFTTKDEGTGLGLSIATRIVEEHGGRLEVESEGGRGAVFVITLPLQAKRDGAENGPPGEG